MCRNGLCITGGPSAYEINVTTRDGTKVDGIFEIELFINAGSGRVTANFKAHIDMLDVEMLPENVAIKMEKPNGEIEEVVSYRG